MFSIGWGLECEGGEVDLGWGDCNEFWSGHSDGCMSSGCYSIEQTTEIRLNYNQIIGVIPPEIGNLINLQSLNFDDNEGLTGELPSEMGNLTNLWELRMRSCSLTGEIPSELGNLTNLTSLDLGSNQLTGEIPLELGNLDNLYYLNLSDNQLSGQIPESICILSLETFVGLNWNSLCPPYPDCGSGPITSENSQDTSECIECSVVLSDLNNDLTLNVIDIISMVNCILSDTCNYCSDFNDDGITDVIDIVGLVNIILDI